MKKMGHLIMMRFHPVRGKNVQTLRREWTTSALLLGPVRTGTVKHIWHQLRGTSDLLLSYSSPSEHLAIRFRSWDCVTGSSTRSSSSTTSLLRVSQATSSRSSWRDPSLPNCLKPSSIGPNSKALSSSSASVF